MFIYPDNLKAKATLRLWQLRDVAIIGVAFLLSVLALAQTGTMLPLVGTVLYAFLAIRWRAPASWTSCGGRPAFCSCSSNTMNGGRRLKHCSLSTIPKKDA